MANTSKFSEVVAAKSKKSTENAVKDGLDEASYKDFLKALSDPSFTTYFLCNVLQDMGVTVSRCSLDRWRKRGV